MNKIQPHTKRAFCSCGTALGLLCAPDSASGWTGRTDPFPSFFLSGSPLQRVCPQCPLHHRVCIGHSHVLHADGLCWCPTDGKWPRSYPGPLRVASPALPPLTSWSPVCMWSLLLIREPWVLSVPTAQRSLEAPCDAPWRGWFCIFAAMALLQTSAEFYVYDGVPPPREPGICPWVS